MITPTRERRDWTLLVFVIPIGIILMLVAGQIAVRFVPKWNVNADMQSNLDPNILPNQQNAAVPPVLPAILTPLGWLDTFLTPGAGSEDQVVFPPFVIFEPSATPEVTLPPPTAVTPSPTAPTATAPIVIVSPPATGTKPPNNGEDPPSTPTPSTPPPTPAPIISTPTGVRVSPPADIVGPPDLSIYNLADGTYIVIDLGSTPIIVRGTSETGYDLVYYEMANPMNIWMDQVTIGISQSPSGDTYYTVFNWGDGVADTNSNVASVAGAENDNQEIDYNILYGNPPPLPIPPNFQTGVAIDVDNAPSNPPAGSYQYLVIVGPETSANDGADINSIEVIPDPPLAPASAMSVQSGDEAPAEPVKEAPAVSGGNTSDPPVENPAPPAEEAPAPATP